MIEVIIKEYLTNLIGVPVMLEQPKDVPNEYVLMELLDEGEVNKVNAITFDFMSHSSTQYNAKVLSDKVRQALEGIVTLDNISSAKFGGARYGMKQRTYTHTITYNFFFYREEII